jgi:hypothetical protein
VQKVFGHSGGVFILTTFASIFCWLKIHCITKTANLANYNSVVCEVPFQPHCMLNSSRDTAIETLDVRPVELENYWELIARKCFSAGKCTLIC